MLNLIKRRMFNRPPSLAHDHFAADVEAAMRRHPAGRLAEVADRIDQETAARQVLGARLLAEHQKVGASGPATAR